MAEFLEYELVQKDTPYAFNAIFATNTSHKPLYDDLALSKKKCDFPPNFPCK